MPHLHVVSTGFSNVVQELKLRIQSPVNWFSIYQAKNIYTSHLLGLATLPNWMLKMQCQVKRSSFLKLYIDIYMHAIAFDSATVSIGKLKMQCQLEDFKSLMPGICMVYLPDSVIQSNWELKKQYQVKICRLYPLDSL